ncbi:hypothetical protein RIF23_13310 [Lipingzhangella sp. LS1_29]|uniref:PE-PGRS family protein n=1 Tax=Lipingzhangella rawalii TaxID=2055835 RepID=A0ABU2H8V0_9ACTN|nr:hypothetical protein [Lipingzhangella rawalii]MDS1271275.1 hypothetical protein [Lipingzhangella rawalii]
MLRAARSLLALRHPLDTELAISELLGAWWGQQVPDGDVERIIGEGLIQHAADSATSAACALLSGISSLGRTRRQRLAARWALYDLLRQGTPRPRWAELLGTARPGDCYVSGSRFGDTDDVICTFDYGDADDPDRHAVIAVIDHNAGGVLRDVWVTSKVTTLVDHGWATTHRDPMATFTPLPATRARTLLETAVVRTEAALTHERGLGQAVSPVSTDLTRDTLAHHHALLRARIRQLPSAPSVVTQPWRREHRATLAARFLASPEAADLSDSYTASRCVDHIIDYGSDLDSGRPLRVSPRKVEAFLLSWLPRRVVLSPAEREAMPHVLAAWIRWAAPRSGLPAEARDATLDALWEATRCLVDAGQDPVAVTGMRPETVRRLLPDGDLAALPRRIFAFPLLTSDYLAEDDAYDPTTPEGRRALLRLDHFNGQQASQGRHSTDSFEGSPELEEALDCHEELARRLWDDDPPNLWAAARRLLDRGHSRMVVLETLLDVLTNGEDSRALVKRLDDL